MSALTEADLCANEGVVELSALCRSFGVLFPPRRHQTNQARDLRLPGVRGQLGEAGMIKRLMCALFGHKYVVIRVFNQGARQVGCTRCGRKWGMHDNTRSLVDWDGDLEQMYRSFGEWK